MNTIPSDSRSKIAREAATLLYFGAEKEYKQAKVKAAKTFGSHFLPTNLEVALELDRIAEETEGTARKERLIRMREEALRVMKTLENYNPALIGSVWRGTIRPGSDIDIVVYYDSPTEIVKLINAKGFEVAKNEWTTVTKKGKTESAFHIYFETTGKQKIEIVVRSSEEARIMRKCEVFRDEIKGLSSQELENLLKDNPTRKFIPS